MKNGTLAFAILFCMVCLAISGFVYYPMVNTILGKFGIDGLSFFQMTLVFSFLHYFTAKSDSVYSHDFFKKLEKEMSEEEKASVYVKTGLRALIRLGITYLVYTYVIIPKFF